MMYLYYQHHNQKEIKIYYEMEGENQAILLLHGWGQNVEMMRFLKEHFQANYKVVVLDLPGFGNSDEPVKPWGVEDYTQLIAYLCHVLQLTNPIVIAHSFGARIALSFAYQYPVKQLFLTGAAGILPKRTLSYYIKVYTYKLLKILHLPNTMGSEDFKNASCCMKQTLSICVNQDLTSLLSQVEAPTLLIWGEKDTQTPLWMGEKMEALMPNATLIIFKDDDHFAYFHQQERFIKVLECVL